MGAKTRQFRRGHGGEEGERRRKKENISRIGLRFLASAIGFLVGKFVLPIKFDEGKKTNRVAS